MTSSDAWIAAAEARAEAPRPRTVLTGVYTGNRVADETIFGELVQLDEGTYGPPFRRCWMRKRRRSRCRAPEPAPSSRPPGRRRQPGAGR